MFLSRYLLVIVLILSIGVVSCAGLATQRIAGDLSQAILNQDDPATVRDGAPAYLLLIDGLIEGSPDSTDLLLAGAKLYSSYAAVFVTEPERAKRLTDKARDYGRRATCQQVRQLCQLNDAPFEEFAMIVRETKPALMPTLFTYAAAWAGWIQAHSDNWNALADLAKVEALLERVIAVDAGYQDGQAHLYLGIIRSQLTPALGGQPERGRDHFERAIKLSDGRNLAARVEYARYYARLVFDRSLHDRLLQEALAADPRQPGLTLSNVLAQQQARQLLAESADYFLE